VPCEGNQRRQRPKGPQGDKQHNQGGLILEPTYPKKNCRVLRPRPRRLRPLCRRLYPSFEIVLPHLADEGGTPVRRACVSRYLGHTAEGNPCRMLVPPYQSSCLRRQSWWLNSSKDAQQEREPFEE
jgi:hypothetical protein